MKKLVVILAVLFSWNAAAVCGTTGTTDKKDEKQATEIVEIKGKYDKQGEFRIGLQLNSGVMFLTKVESIESHLNAFSDFGITADKFLGSKTWALNTGLSYTAFKLSTTVRDNEEVPADQGTYTRTDTKGGNLSLPINIKYRSDLIGQRSKLYALAGVSFCMQTGASRQMITPVSKSGVVLSQGKAVALTDKVNGCAVNIGTGMEFNTGGLRTITAGIQYQKGLGTGAAQSAMVRDNMSLSFGFFF